MARAAGWKEETTMTRTRIDSNIYRSPVGNDYDAVSMAVLHLTRKEAEAIQSLARAMQKARDNGERIGQVTLGWMVTDYSLFKEVASGGAGKAVAPMSIRDGWKPGTPLPPGWSVEIDPTNMVSVFTVPDGTRYVVDSNNDLVPLGQPSSEPRERTYNVWRCINGHALASRTAWCYECDKADMSKGPVLKTPAVAPVVVRDANSNRFSGLELDNDD